MHPAWPQAAATEAVCYLTTVGRRTCRAHTIEIWFAALNSCIYFLSGGGDRSDWVRNVRQQAAVDVRIGSETRSGAAYVVVDLAEDALARRLLAAKYQGWREGRPLSGWARTALPVAVAFP